MVEIVDSLGRAHEAIIAEQDLEVHDPIFGFNRLIFAGQPVPGDLEDAYNEAIKATKVTKKTAPKK